MTTRTKQANRLAVESLEAREIPSITSCYLSGGMIYVWTDNASTSAQIYQSGTNHVVSESGSGRTWSFAASQVSKIQFVGGAGNDRFVNNVSTLASSAWGYGGNDYLEGYGAADYFVGGEGNDELVGYGGNDSLFGEGGRDKLRGMGGDDMCSGGGNDDVVVGDAGNDTLYGGEGHDQIVGGAGTDYLYGGNGDDTLTTIDGGTTDYADGQGGRDTAWLDQNMVWNWWGPSFQWDTCYVEKGQNVMGFANGADRTLDGDWIADPTDGTNYKSFRGNFLFGDGGPVMEDIDQGGLGDCWLLAPLAAAVGDNQYVGREMVADFGDGTYGVRLGGSFYRVDGDLPTASATSTALVNAGLGAQNSIWVAIVEKAYAIHRTGANTYASLAGGDELDAFNAYNLASTGGSHYNPGSNTTTIANDLYEHWWRVNNSCTLGTGSVPVGSPLVANHAYTVTWIDRDAAGNVTRIYLRNPWGTNGGTSNPYLSITPAQLANVDVWLRWGISS